MPSPGLARIRDVSPPSRTWLWRRRSLGSMILTTPFGERTGFFEYRRRPENKTKTRMKSYRVSLASSFVAVVVLVSLVSQHFTNAFLGKCLLLHPSTPRISLLRAAPDDDREDQSHKDALRNDADFYRELRMAKSQMLGRSIPPEQARESAAQAENDFLQAMKETADEFKKAKDELGSDGAVDLFLERIREEDERDNEEEDEED